jgi:hypothetical protein
MMFRSGYRSGFPAKPPVTDKQAEEGRQKDIDQRSERTAKLNKSTHRREERLEIGDVVLTRNNKRSSKFQPTFDPTPRTITNIEHGGITCTEKDGTTQRRHVDDVKKAPTTMTEKHSKLLLTKNRPTEQTGTMTTPTTQTHQNDMMGHSSEKKRPHRQPRLPARYRSETFTT